MLWKWMIKSQYLSYFNISVHWTPGWSPHQSWLMLPSKRWLEICFPWDKTLFSETQPPMFLFLSCDGCFSISFAAETIFISAWAGQSLKLVSFYFCFFGQTHLASCLWIKSILYFIIISKWICVSCLNYKLLSSTVTEYNMYVFVHRHWVKQIEHVRNPNSRCSPQTCSSRGLPCLSEWELQPLLSQALNPWSNTCFTTTSSQPHPQTLF